MSHPTGGTIQRKRRPLSATEKARTDAVLARAYGKLEELGEHKRFYADWVESQVARLEQLGARGIWLSPRELEIIEEIDQALDRLERAP